MRLSTQQFSDVLTTLRTLCPKTGESDKRRFSRMEVQAKIALAVIGDSKTAWCYTALTRDICFAGIGVLQSVPAQRGDRLLVRLPRGEKPPVMVFATVTYCKTLADGLFDVGAEFVTEADPNTVRQIAETGAANSSHTREGAADRWPRGSAS